MKSNCKSLSRTLYKDSVEFHLKEVFSFKKEQKCLFTPEIVLWGQRNAIFPKDNFLR